MRFYNREKKLAILQNSEQQSFENATFTVLMGLSANITWTQELSR